MKKVLLLVTTMHETDFSKFHSMNIHSDVLFANQADSFSYARETINGYDVQMVTTATRGLSRNRNVALACADKEADYVLFADDDLTFRDDYVQTVCGVFQVHPEADAVKFNINVSANSSRKLGMKPIRQFKKAGRRDITASGVCCMAVKMQVLLKKNLHFNTFFGAGTENYCGEDTIFLQDMIKNGVRLYLSPEALATIDQSKSTWFDGYTEKFFAVKGMVLAAIYPRLSYPLAVRSAYRFARKKKCGMSFFEILKCYCRGVTSYLKSEDAVHPRCIVKEN